MAMVSMVVGATTATTARFVCKVDTGPASVDVSTAEDMSGATRFGPASVDAQGVAKVEATGLTADTAYFWRTVDNGTQDTSATGQFRTHPTLGDPASYTLAAAACAGQAGDYVTDDVSNHPVFDTIRGHAPLMFLHCGDLHYRDITTDSDASFRDAYDDVLAQSRQHQLYRTVPWVYTWDDHDFGGDNSDGTSAAKPAAQTVYRERVPHYDLDDADAIYQSFGVGRVLYIVSDARSDRSPNSDPDGPSKTMLGSAQKTWMESLLTTPGFDAQFLVWVVSSEWLGTASDSWGSFATERAEMVEMFGDLDWLDRMCIVSGDMHALAISTEAGNGHGGFPVFHFASLESTPTQQQSQYDLGQMPGYGQYGLLRVVDDGTPVGVTGTGYVGSRPWQWYSSGSARTRRGPRSHVIAL